MNNIKFRVWDVQEKTMKLVRNINYADDGFSGTICVGIVGEKGVKVHGENCILMQCTGLKDKNGNDIYVGDIVRYEDEDGYKLEGEVKLGRYGATKTCLGELGIYIDWYGDFFGRQDILFWVEEKGVQKVGCIYENPELLKP